MTEETKLSTAAALQDIADADAPIIASERAAIREAALREAAVAVCSFMGGHKSEISGEWKPHAAAGDSDA